MPRYSDTQDKGYDTSQQRRDNSLAHQPETQLPQALAQNAAGVDALDAHGTLGQHEIEEVDGSNDDDEQRGQLKDEEHGGVALVVGAYAGEVSVANRSQAELKAEVGVKLCFDVCLLILIILARSNYPPPLPAPHQLAHLFGEVFQQGVCIDILGQLHVEGEAPLTPIVEIVLAGVVEIVLHRAVVGEVLIDTLHCDCVSF